MTAKPGSLFGIRALSSLADRVRTDPILNVGGHTRPVVATTSFVQGLGDAKVCGGGVVVKSFHHVGSRSCWDDELVNGVLGSIIDTVEKTIHET